MSITIHDTNRGLGLGGAAVLASLVTGGAIAAGLTITLLAAVGVLLAIGLVSRWPLAVLLVWLVAAPFVQDAAQASALGNRLALMVGLLPGLVLIASTRRCDSLRSWKLVDYLPAGFIAVVGISLAFESGEYLLSAKVSLGHQFAQGAGLALGMYYIGRSLPRTAADLDRIFLALLLAGTLAAGLAVCERFFGLAWWGFSGWRTYGRLTGPFINPAILGTSLGMTVTLAAAVVAWGRDRRLRSMALVALLVCFPILVLTWARASIAAATLAVIVIGLTRRRTRAGIVTAIAIATVLFLSFGIGGIVGSSRADKLRDPTNVEGRALIANWSLRLAAAKPFLGWGYGTFDGVKQQIALPAIGVPVSYGLNYTSHNTFLTILVELGTVGAVMFILPLVWAFVTAAAAFRSSTSRAVVIGLAGAIAVFGVNAAAIDMRFFSYVPAVAWLLVGICRSPRLLRGFG